MNLALVLARVGLAAVFAIAGVAKMADREGTARAAREFGLGRFAPLAASTVPLVELALAATLVPATSARFAAAGAALLFVVFASVIGIALAHGRRPDCHCFGKLHSSAAGPGMFVRNACLAALAVLVAARPVPHAGWLELASSGAALLVAAQSLLAFTLLRRYGRALRRIEELEAGVERRAALAAGDEAPEFTLPRLGGGEVALHDLLAPARSLLLLFVDPGCGPCHELVPELAGWLDGRVTPVFISRGEVDANATFADHGEVLLQREHEVAELYAAEATPSAILISSDGRIEQPLATGHGAIEELARVTAEPTVVSESRVAGRARVMATAAAAGLATTAAAAKASPSDQAQRSVDPGLQAIAAALRAAGPGLAAAEKRSQKAVRAQTNPNLGQKLLKARRTAARDALAAERREVIALRDKLKKVTLSTTSERAAYNARTFGVMGLDLLAQSLQKRERSIGAAPRVALPLINDSQRLFLRALDAITASAKFLGPA